MFWLAVITGLIFARFSRPTARIEFSKSIVIAPFDGRPTLMLRVPNLRHDSISVEAEFRIMFTRNERILEDDSFRRFYMLKLDFDRLIIFPAALTLRHTIDEQSPLQGETAESLQASDARLVHRSCASKRLFPPPCRLSTTTPGAMCVSASASSKSKPRPGKES